ncbi:MAG TPA: SGNH/GDSL hydrolase family protein [Bacteroidia bacterium]|nr:SGNH/GDSL hydrolase family protein [Bacteroidia bacterium]
MNWETYIAFGDSITIGARTYLGYPELTGHALGTHLSKEWNVINHAVSGFKAIDLARYIDEHFTTLKEHKASVSTILIGTNDIKEKTSLADFRIALDQVILKVKLLTVSKNVIILAIPEFQKGIMYPYSMQMNESIREFNAAIEEAAGRHGIRSLELVVSEEDFLDGVHLNNTGNQSFSSQLTRYILADKGIDVG